MYYTKTIPGRYHILIALKLNIHDAWVGLYWKRYPKAIDLFICILPCLPIEIYVESYHVQR